MPACAASARSTSSRATRAHRHELRAEPQAAARAAARSASSSVAAVIDALVQQQRAEARGVLDAARRDQRLGGASMRSRASSSTQLARAVPGVLEPHAAPGAGRGRRRAASGAQASRAHRHRRSPFARDASRGAASPLGAASPSWPAASPAWPPARPDRHVQPQPHLAFRHLLGGGDLGDAAAAARPRR